MIVENTTDTSKHKFFLPELVLLLLSTLTVMAGVTLTPALPALRANFSSIVNVDLLVRLTLTITPLFIALGAPIIGVIVDKWGRKNLILITTVLYGIAGSAGFFLTSLEAIIVSRALLGIAVAGIMTTATTLIADYYQGEQRNKVMGYQGSFLAYGGIIFLLVGGFLASIGWQFPFLIYSLAFLLVPGIWIYLYEPERSRLASKSETEKVTPDFALTVPYLALGIVYGSTLIFQIFFYFTLTELPFFLANSLQLKPDLIGVVLASATLSAGTFSLLFKQIKKHINFTTIFAISFLSCGIGFIIIYLSNDVVGIVISLLVAGIGLGLFVPNSTVWMTSVSPELSRGLILSGFMSSLFLGQFISPFVSQMLLESIEFAELFALGGLVLISVGFITLAQRFVRT
ncbi:MAG: MFS transporter [Candidatus Hodarchaeales archaeon]|jgi:MFS family permease